MKWYYLAGYIGAILVLAYLCAHALVFYIFRHGLTFMDILILITIGTTFASFLTAYFVAEKRPFVAFVSFLVGLVSAAFVVIFSLVAMV